MRRDSLFYTFFQRSPTSIFELLPNPPADAAKYRFDSVAVKEAKFEIDGVFLPPEGEPGTIYFCEVQMQKIKTLYERLFAEAFLYFYQNRHRFSDWQAVVIYPSRSTEQDDVHPFRAMLSSEQMHVIYLDELDDTQQLPLWIALMVLTTVRDRNAIEDAKALVARARAEKSLDESRIIIDTVATIIGYKFGRLTLQEIQAMLDIPPIKESRLYQEARQEAQASLIVRLLKKRFGELPDELVSRIGTLSSPEAETLAEEVLDFSKLADVQDWLKNQAG
ncbi:MAG: DUF2887 domain-containing protein [Cyanobacteria bacterium J06598_3]